jgi:YesN/AraC family two-component response regulator
MDQKSLTLLCVEDDKTSQLIYEATLSDKVKKIYFADNGLEGYEKFIAYEIDLIISDYKMPVLDGLGMIGKIRKVNIDVPIILISAIDDIDVMVNALQLGVTNFVRKPLVAKELLEALESASKLVIANHFLEQQRKEKLQELERKNNYATDQEALAFAKELNILRNDFYYQMVEGKEIILLDFLYQPLDIMSGDAYSARRISANSTFYLIVDGMGKGLSASLSAMLMTAFVNHLVDKMLESNDFNFEMLIQESITYIKPILLDEEALAIDYILFDNDANKLHYSKFAMPVFLLETKEREIVKIKSNNPPLSKWQGGFKVDQYNIKDIEKFLFYSDGIVENNIKNSDETYAQLIEEDFLHSFTKEEFKRKLLDSITEQEDDLSLIFINKLNNDETLIAQREFSSSLESIDEADEWYTQLLESLSEDPKTTYSANLTFTELFMNAYEHGNLGLSSREKHRLLEEDIYFETLQEREIHCDKKIIVSLHKVNNQGGSYIITRISDEGKGFDTQNLSEIFRNSQKFNGRGVFVSRKNSMGIYYNTVGNSVLFLSQL